MDDHDTLERLSKDDLVTLVLTQAAEIAMLTGRVTALEAKLGLPPKTPDNSSLPPSKGQKPSLLSVPERKAKSHPGAHRLLHPEPTSRRDERALSSQACEDDVSGAEQSPCEVYDRVAIPAIVPDVTRVSLHGSKCPYCAKQFKAEALAGLETGSSFGPNIRVFVIYLRAVQGMNRRRTLTLPPTPINPLQTRKKSISFWLILDSGVMGPWPALRLPARPGSLFRAMSRPFLADSVDRSLLSLLSCRDHV